MTLRILEIAVPTPLRRCFDYALPHDHPENASIAPGTLTQVGFGGQLLIGIVLTVKNITDVPIDKLKAVDWVGDKPCLPEDLVALISWAASYYHRPIGEAFATALPVLLRQGQPEIASAEPHYRLTREGKGLPENAIKRAKQQSALLTFFQSHESLTKAEIIAEGFSTAVLKQLITKKLVEPTTESIEKPVTDILRQQPLEFTPEQAQAFSQLKLNQFQISLLDGVTGSGKTEIYLQAIEKVLREGKQALILVPEIGLTPQTIARFQARFAQPICCLHSGLNDRERLDAWIAAKKGIVKIVIGTRSAIFTPMPQLGMIIIDEEHDASFKQQDGFRYSARDLAAVRARNANIPLLLGSATPALETLYNALQGRYTHLKLQQRAGNARAPSIELIDIRNKNLTEGFAPETRQAIADELAKHNQVLVFLNRRGFAPAIECHHCGWMADCSRCSVRMTLHLSPKHLRCHHCDKQSRIPTRCPKCNSSQLNPLGHGTERSELALSNWFPDTPIIRVDRDTTRNKNALSNIVDQVHQGDPCILVGTQMLAKGHHFPRVTLVVILDADAGLFSTDFRGPEKMGQLLLQVAGRAGRADLPGKVILQSHHTDHPLTQTLLFSGYHSFADALLKERQLTNMPPFGHMVLIRAESKHADIAGAFLEKVKSLLLSIQKPDSDRKIIGPMPCMIEKRGDRYRLQIQLVDNHRKRVQTQLQQLTHLLEKEPLAKRVRWSIDVDPIDLS